MNDITTAERIDLFKSVVIEHRYTQNSWNRFADGKHYLCLASAWGKPGEINNTTDCPVSLFPQWLFELMPTLDDGVSADDVPWLFEGFAQRAEGMVTLQPDAWERIRTGFMIASIRQAIDYAEPVQPVPAPACWLQVKEACEGVINALNGKGDLKKAARAAYAAYAAADAAYAARAADAAYAAARAAYAAYAAADAAYAARAAYAAARAAARAAADAADAAADAAYRKLAEILFALIDAEIGA